MEPSSSPLWGHDPLVREALHRAGWSDGRSVDTAGWVRELRGVGYQPHSLAVRIWAALGGLTVRSAPMRVPPSSLHVDPVDACIDSLEESQRLSRRLGEDLSPLGMWSVQFRTYVGASGRVVAVTGGTLWELGTDFPEVLAYVVRGDGGGSRAERADWLL
ncbi:SUKH-3 domain-containing protein [Streptomyces longwoodensis]